MYISFLYFCVNEMGRNKKYNTQAEKEEADRSDKRRCYHKHKELYNYIEKGILQQMYEIVSRQNGTLSTNDK